MKEHIHEYMKYVRTVLARIQYRDWRLVVTRDSGHTFLHAEYPSGDSITAIGQKFYLGTVDDPISADAIIRTAYLAIKTAEARERDRLFTVDGIPLNHPGIKTAARQEAYFHTFPMQEQTGRLA